MSQKFDVVIIGGGLVGGAFALDLSRQNPALNIALMEAAEPVTAIDASLDNKIYAISPVNVMYLKQLQAWPDEARIGTINAMDVFGDEDSNLLLERNLPKQLFLAKTIESKYLLAHIYDRLHDIQNITFIDDQLTQIVQHETYAELITTKNIKYHTTLIVGADGANSLVRRLSNLDAKMVDYQESGVVANFACELPHKNIAYQWFKDNSVLAYLPLPQNHISIVWSSNNAKEMLAMPDKEFAELVARVGEYKLGKLTTVTRAVAFPLRMYLLDRVYSDKTVLVGDAAHTIHPLAGQGVNLGFKDAQLLAKILSGCKRYQLANNGVLARYNAMRIVDVRKMQLTCNMLRRLFKHENSMVKTIRNRGLNLVNSLNFIKNKLIQSAVT